ncbi:protein of unknown function [Candidatus Methylomirabilis oxygeniifera]|uniref:Uncharacterized protein n=1 Tax=Methylomirabilis oxygeniifera TaxID=671143 RepID=D5MHI9_METO1|nr:protein of unknown function [Candidatus Methylomirabilis oxyfera]
MGGQRIGAGEKESNLLVDSGVSHVSVVFVQHRVACSGTRLPWSAARPVQFVPREFREREPLSAGRPSGMWLYVACSWGHNTLPEKGNKG